ncbi:putative linoleate 9S-lipoxygenase 5 [Vitis vinifera]|uniref:Putative linoleate 9S-lipoxygenase 5 n=1 Tax=Vitis vinifera TaxID=29760 RepID=A0A438KCH9_VITVI|nr:putative linoleate 9S-lipoxygenase 5 [Vitis vinifera]
MLVEWWRAQFFPSKYAMEMSSVVYKDWVLLSKPLPADLIKRYINTVEWRLRIQRLLMDFRLLIDDYPYAVDGLEIWSAIETWVKEYCSFYYKTDEMVQKDSELQSWWKEVREEGHGDKKDEPWWPKMHTAPPNRPTISRRFMPEEGTPEYEELKSNPDKAFLKTITAQLQTLLGISLIEILSRHSSDEVYLGQRDTPEWTLDTTPLKAFENSEGTGRH